MIIKSHIRGGYRAAADYLKNVGKNEKIRLVEISDMGAKTLDEAFHNMWVTACNSKVKKPLHHISINPFKDERLTDEQVLKIVERAEDKYGYKRGDHQRVIVEHILDGRQHFHVMWCRVSMATGKSVWPGEHWKKSKQICREMEKELGLQTPVPRRIKKRRATLSGFRKGKAHITTRAPMLGKAIKGGAIKGKTAPTPSTETRQAPPPALQASTRKENTNEPKLTPRRDMGEMDMPASRASLAYQEEFGKWAGLIEAAANDQSVSKEQRQANVASLRIQQRTAAKAAYKKVRDEERNTARAARRARRILLGLPDMPQK